MNFETNSDHDNHTEKILPLDSKKIQYIFDLLKSEIILQKNVVLILGNTGSGKTIFSKFITDKDDRLISIKDGDTFEIKDKLDDTQHASEKMFPNLQRDIKLNTAFYDFLGFDADQSAAKNIANSYFMNKVVDFADKVKIVFTISYFPDTKAINQEDFVSLTDHAVTLINNFNKFTNNIALVVTKVVNERKENNKLIAEDTFKENIAKVLRNVKTDYLINLKSKGDLKNTQKAVEFIDILLTKVDQNYKNIGIFKRPSKIGRLEDDELQLNKKSLKSMIHMNIKFSKISKDDFKYTIPPNSEIYLHPLKVQIENNILDNLESVGEEVRNYYKNQEVELHDIESLRDTFFSGYKIWSRTSNSLNLQGMTISKCLVKILNQGINDSFIRISSSNLLNLENNLDYLSFVETIKNNTITSKSLLHTESIANVAEYLNNSQKYYKFLVKIYSLLSRYELQKDIKTYANVASSFIALPDDKKETAVKDLIEFFPSQTRENFKKEFKNLGNVEWNKSKLHFLNEIFNSTLLYKIDSSCNPNAELIIRGNYLQLQNVDQIANERDCIKPKSIKMFALNKIFIDSDFDKTGEKVQLSIIAPIWEIINTRKIILDGIPTTNITLERARDGQNSIVQRRRNGEDGKVGIPGGSSGRFIGIGKTFISDENLSIFVNGGKGGPGQDGGNGHKGMDGTVQSDCKSCTNRISVYTPGLLDHCFLYGKNCTNGGDGGKGGAGGAGGHAERIIFIPLENDSKVNLYNQPGEKGNDGIGGLGSIAGKFGYNTRVFFEKLPNFLGFQRALREVCHYQYFKNPSCKSGEKGTVVKNIINNKEPAIDNVEAPSNIINDYKIYVWKNTQNNIRKNFLIEFIKKLEAHKLTEELYNSMGFVNEMLNLEKIFCEFNDKFMFLSLYKSLLHRINDYANKPMFKAIELKHDLKLQDSLKILYYLSAAAQSKINSFQDQNEDLVLNLSHYLASVENEFKEFKNLNNVVSINKFNKDYQSSIQDKTEEAEMLIKNQITPEIDDILEKIDDELDELINDTIARQNNTIKEVQKLVTRRQNLESKLILKAYFGVTKTVSQFLGLAGPVGVIAGTAMSIGATVGETLFANDKEDSPLYERVAELPAAVTKSISSIEETLKDKQKLFKEQIDDLEKEINKIESEDVHEVKEKITEVKNIVNLKVSNHTLNNITINEMTEMRGDISHLLQNKTALFKGKKDESNKNDKQLKTLEKMQKIIKISQLPLEFYKNIRKDQDKLDQVSAAINAKQEDLKKLEKYENDIYAVMVPICDNIRNTANETQKNLKNKSHVSLDITKWKIQSNLRDFQQKLTKMTEGYKEIQEDFIHFIDKLCEGMTTMIIVYDRIQSYQERADFAKYIAKINSNFIANDIGDETLNDHVNQLMLIIQKNIILEKYNAVIKAFGQYVYPYADEYLSGYNLSSDCKIEDIDTLIRNATMILHNLKRKLTDTENLYKSQDSDIFSDNHYDKQYGKPFFTWKYDEYKQEISKLLQKQIIFIKSDVKKSHKKNAVKFNDINIYFKLKDKSLQHNFDKLIGFFQVEMTHLGNSYYKCDNKIHLITSRNVTFKLTLHNNYKQGNNALKKIHKNEPLLSPYTMWMMKLKYIGGDDDDVDPDELKSYVSQPMDIVLEGMGQHVDGDSNVCNSGNLDKYYILYDTISETKHEEKDRLHRERRSLKEHLSIKDTEPNFFATSGSASNIKSSFLYKIVNLIRSGLVALEYFSPLKKVNQWFNNRGSTICEDEFKLQNTNHAIMEFLNILPVDSANLPSTSKMFIDYELPIRHDELLNSYLLCNKNNLLLLDLLIRWKNGTKHEQRNILRNQNFDFEFAHNLAYKTQLLKNE